MIWTRRQSFLFAAGLILGCLAVFSCGKGESNLPPTIKQVETILADKTSPEYRLLASFKSPQPMGEVCIIARSEVCNLLSEYFYSYDRHDNVTGKLSPDALPDFAGETFGLISEDSSYGRYIKDGNTEELRRQTLMRALCAVDTLTHISPYDLEGAGGKAPAKLIILADPYLSEYGKYDIERLFAGTGCGIPVISPLESTLDTLFRHFNSSAEAGGNNAKLSMGLIYNPSTAPSSVYARSFSKVSSNYGGGECYLFPSDRKDSLLHRFVASYAGTRDVPVDVLVVDDPAVDVESLKTELADVVSVMNASSLKYGKILSSSFRICSSSEELARTLYLMFRQRNLFTHNISFPLSVYYNPVSAAGTEDGKIILTSGIDVQN